MVCLNHYGDPISPVPASSKHWHFVISSPSFLAVSSELIVVPQESAIDVFSHLNRIIQHRSIACPKYGAFGLSFMPSCGSLWIQWSMSDMSSSFMCSYSAFGLSSRRFRDTTNCPIYVNVTSSGQNCPWIMLYSSGRREKTREPSQGSEQWVQWQRSNQPSDSMPVCGSAPLAGGGTR